MISNPAVTRLSTTTAVLLPTLFVMLSATFTTLTLDSKGLWIDELMSVVFSEPADPFRHTIYKLEGEVHPLSYYMLLKFWRLFVPSTEIGLRALGVTIFYAMVPAIYYVMRRGQFSNSHLVIYMFFYLLSSYPILFAQYARPYILVYALIYILLPLVVHTMRSGLTWPRLLVASSITLLAAYTHFFGALLAYGQLAALALLLFLNGGRREACWVLVALGLVTMLYVPQLLFVVLHLKNDVLVTYKFFSLGPYNLFWGGYYATGGFVGAAIIVVLATLALWRLRSGLHQYVSDLSVCLPVLAGVISFVVMVVLDLVQPVVRWPSLGLFAPILFFLLAHALAMVLNQAGGDVRLGRSVAVLLAAFAVASMVTVYTAPVTDWRQAGEILRAYARTTGCPIPSVDLTKPLPRGANWNEVIAGVHSFYLKDMAGALEFTGPSRIEGCPVVYYEGGHLIDRVENALKTAGIEDAVIREFQGPSGHVFIVRSGPGT